MLKVKQLLFVSLMLLVCQVWAQTYPFGEGFEGLPSGQVPAGWGGSMKVALAHGRDDSKGLIAKLSSTIRQDSTITPPVGPLNSQSVVSFYYRVVDQNIYPSTPTVLDDGDTIDFFISTDNQNYEQVHSINKSNHATNLNFVRRQIWLGPYSGSNVTLKVRCRFGSGGGYFVDFDTISFRNDPQAAIAELNDDAALRVYPNPCNYATGCHIQVDAGEAAELLVLDIAGRVVYRAENFTKGTLPANGWQPGLYFVRAGTTTRKLIVE